MDIKFRFHGVWVPHAGWCYSSEHLAVWVDVYLNGEYQGENGNRLAAIGFDGIPGLVYAPDYRSDWYGYGVKRYSPLLIPLVRFPKLYNNRGQYRRKVRRAVAHEIRRRAISAGLKEGRDYTIAV